MSEAIPRVLHILNIALCAIGLAAYAVFLVWTVAGVWPLAFYALKTLLVTMSTGLPTPPGSMAFTLPMAGLAAYYSIASPMISRVFKRFPVLRPILVMGFVFYFGISVTYLAVDALTNSGLGGQTGAMAVGITGILLTRLLMSWLFTKAPVEVLAGLNR